MKTSMTRLLAILKKALFKIKSSSSKIIRVIWSWVIKKSIQFPRFITYSNNWLPIIVATIAISGFWNALGYFSPNVSLKIIRTSYVNPFLEIDSIPGNFRNKTIVTHSISDFRNFYRNNQIPFPKAVYNDRITKKIFDPDGSDILNELNDSIYRAFNNAKSELERLQAFNSISLIRPLDPGFLSILDVEIIPGMEQQLDTLSWHNKTYSRQIHNSELDYQRTALGKHFKKTFSNFEYYTYLCALLYSRKVENQLLIKNESEISLENVSILIPPPESRVLGANSDNILKVEVDLAQAIFYTTKKEEKNLIINIPVMKPQEFLLLRIITRESEILPTNILSTYKEVPTINSKRALATTLLIFSILLLIQFLCHRD